MKRFLARIPVLCRGEPEAISQWLNQPEWRWLMFCCVIITLGAGLYGTTIGLWRGPLMALYVGVKLPLLIFLTTLCNAGLNWMLAQVMGVGIGFRQTLVAQLMSYTVAALLLASVAPITLFILFNTPPLSSGNHFGHRFFLLLNVAIIAVVGMVANGRLYQCLELNIKSCKLARRILVAWLAGNLFVGAQLSWNLRPFIGSPGLEIQFVRPNPFDGNFYESVYQNVRQVLSPAVIRDEEKSCTH